MRNQRRYIVVEGPIGVGKTTLAKKLAESFGSQLLLEGAADNPFLPRFYANPRQAALSTQLFFLLQRAQQIQDMRQGELFTPVWVADFLLDKDRLFAELTLDSDELALYEQVYQHLTIDAPTPDLVIYLQAPVSVLNERIGNRGVEFEQSISREYLQRLSDSYMHFFHHYERSPLLIVNTESVNLANNEDDYHLLLDRVNSISGGTEYFNPRSFPV
ncbi:MAG: deoxynucleoside kinase [Pseudomonadota bacterium]